MFNSIQQPAAAAQPPGGSWFMPTDFIGSPLASLAAPDYRAQLAYQRTGLNGAAPSSATSAGGSIQQTPVGGASAMPSAPVRQSGLSSGHATAVMSAPFQHQRRASVQMGVKSSDSVDGPIKYDDPAQLVSTPTALSSGMKPRNVASAAAARMYVDRPDSPSQRPASPSSQQVMLPVPPSSTVVSSTRDYSERREALHQQPQQPSTPQASHTSAALAAKINLHGIWSKDLEVRGGLGRSNGCCVCLLAGSLAWDQT